MSKKNSLGKGLGVLFQDNALLGDTADSAKDTVVELPLGNIDPNREQPRKRFDEDAMARLCKSIRVSGVIQPIIVYGRGDRYVIIAGERRWRAARAAGLETIPAIVRDYDRMKRMEVALVENIQRENLNPLEEAAAVHGLMEECGLTQESVSERIGRSRPAIANLLRLLTLPDTVQDMLRDGRLSAGHGRALAAIGDERRLQALADSAVRQGWSVRQTEAAASRKPRVAPKARAMPAELTDLEDALRRALGMRASISGSARRGRIVLTYASADELEYLYEALRRILDEA